ncbi:sulfurtransferase complex subunit TusC [Alishewanella sp. 16-MA]|uniref:Sulfurtransferase complex subunit TusC n=1 Tax=Alishewanella maricola TaxID=2795740 RepID=A0ABS8C4Z0_9ALTE|nr:sulfurtransferase complex subunit TusC [Alishewanella maricola]MCB5227395.1 sulfurtransferase complex subunit TusC [Alishewanella maricola]
MQHILILQTQSPFNQARAREALDLTLALAAVDYQLSVIFMADAVFQLVSPAELKAPPIKPVYKSFGLFGLYDIEQCFVCQQALTQRGLTALPLPPGFQTITPTAITALMCAAEQVIRC